MERSVMFISNVVWNFYRGRNFEITTGICRFFDKVYFLEPLRYKGYESIRFQNVSLNELEPNIDVLYRKISLKKSFLITIIENFQNLWYIIKYDPDVVIGWDILTCVFVSIYCKLIGKRFVLDYKDDWELVDTGFHGWIVKYFFKPWTAWRAHSVIGISHRLVEKTSKFNKKSYRIPNAKQGSFISKISNQYKDVKPKKKIVLVGSIRGWYDRDILFELSRRLPEYHIDIYGKGDMYDELLQKSQEYDNVSLYGNIDHAKSYEVLAESFCGIINLTLAELNQSTLPIKLFDYMALSKPIISSRVNELVQIDNKYGGILFYDDIENLVKNIKMLEDDKNLYQELSSKSLENLKKYFNYDFLLEEYFRILTK